MKAIPLLFLLLLLTGCYFDKVLRFKVASPKIDSIRHGYTIIQEHVEYKECSTSIMGGPGKQIRKYDITPFLKKILQENPEANALMDIDFRFTDYRPLILFGESCWLIQGKAVRFE